MNPPRARAYHIRKIEFLRATQNFFCRKFWRLEKRFYNAVYSKAKQTATKYGENETKKYTEQKRFKQSSLKRIGLITRKRVNTHVTLQRGL